MIRKIILTSLVLISLISLLYLYNPFTVLEVIDSETDLDTLYRIDVEVHKEIDESICYSLTEDDDINSFLNILDKMRIRRNLDRILYTSMAYPKFKETYSIQLLDSNNKVIGRIWIRDKRYISINSKSYTRFKSNITSQLYELLLDIGNGETKFYFGS